MTRDPRRETLRRSRARSPSLGLRTGPGAPLEQTPNSGGATLARPTGSPHRAVASLTAARSDFRTPGGQHRGRKKQQRCLSSQSADYYALGAPPPPSPPGFPRPRAAHSPPLSPGRRPLTPFRREAGRVEGAGCGRGADRVRKVRSRGNHAERSPVRRPPRSVPGGSAPGLRLGRYAFLTQRTLGGYVGKSQKPRLLKVGPQLPPSDPKFRLRKFAPSRSG